MARRRDELILVLALLALAALVWFWLIPATVPAFVDRDSGDISARFVPQLATAVMILALLGRLFRLIVPVPVGPLAPPDPEPVEPLDRRSVVVLAGVALFALVLIRVVGFHLASALLALGFARYLGQRRPLVLAAFTLVLVAGIHLLFEHVFGIPLPRGTLWRGLAALGRA